MVLVKKKIKKKITNTKDYKLYIKKPKSLVDLQTM